jgi:hypothetical protein
MSFLGPNNALAWAHFRLRGGWRRTATVTVCGVGILAGVVITGNRLAGDDGGKTLFGWTMALLAFQAACLILYTAGRIGSIVRADAQSKMIESHRLMPIPSMHAVAGYIVGAATQPLVFCCGLFILGAAVATAAGIPLPRWTFANGILLAFAVFVWVVTAYASLGGRIGGGILTGAIMIPWLTQGMVLALLPGVAVLLSPVMGQSIFDLRTEGITLPATYAISFAAQIYFGVICFIAAARAYRSSVEVSMDTVLGLCLLLGWVALSIAGLREWDDFRPRGFSIGKIDEPVRVVASLLAALVIAIVPVSANVYERARWRRHVAIGDPYPMRRPPRIAGVIIVAVAVVLAIPFAPKEAATPTPDLLLRSAAIVTIALTALAFIFDLLYRSSHRAAGPAAIWIVLTWLVPIAIDWARYTLGDFGENEHLAGFSTCSPVGALIILWTGGVVSTTYGIGVQILIALVPMLLWITTYMRRGTIDAPRKRGG